MKISEINIRDPFIVEEDGKFYMFGTRAANFGIKTGGFDVYLSNDLEVWSEPMECCNTDSQGLNRGANWAPEVWRYNGKFYMLATFTKADGLRGTYALAADEITGPYKKCGDSALTPDGWECLDGTLYISKDNKPYLVFCHEHTQIIDGTMCYVQLKEDFSGIIGEPKLMFAASQPYYVDNHAEGHHYITDGPFLYRTSSDELIMIWSTILSTGYAECMAYSDNGEIDGNFIHIEPLFKDDGGHGMIFEKQGKLCLVLHSPNASGFERPKFIEIGETEDGKGLLKL